MKSRNKPVGAIIWTDLTAPRAPRVRDFYQAVVGWESDSFMMLGGEDYVMRRPSDRKVVAGICNARGVNEKLPPQWLVYITVASLPASLRACRSHGGKVLTKPRAVFQGRFAVVQDPVGAVAALYEAAG